MSEAVPEGVARDMPGPGALLREAREARGMTVAEVSAALKMSPRQIEAAEAGDFSRLSNATFMRGFVRNYARLLGIDAARLLAALDRNMDMPKAELIVPAKMGLYMPEGYRGHGRGLLAATLGALFLLGVALALHFDVIDIGVGREADPPPPVEAQAVQPVPVMEAVEPVPQPPVDARQPVRKDGDRQLVFGFDADAWVEVKDGSGKTLLSQLNGRGSTETVLGRPPFQIVIGNASQVRLQYEDRAVDLAPHIRVEVARLTLE